MRKAMPVEEMKEITLDELAERKKAGADMSRVQVSGTIRIVDKDGKLKAELPITRIDEDAN